VTPPLSALLLLSFVSWPTAQALPYFVGESRRTMLTMSHADDAKNGTLKIN